MDQSALHLRNEDQWACDDGIYVRGKAFRDGELLSGGRLISLFRRSMEIEQFRSIVSTLNGSFAVVIQSSRFTFAAVDRWRRHPLFYSITPETVYISDDSHWIRDVIDCENNDEVAEAEYMRSLFVSGSNTLTEDVNQIQGGELLVVRPGDTGPSVTTKRYYRYGCRQTRDRDSDELIREYEAMLENVFQRLIEFADGRPIAISLSAGPDSRLIALMLAEIGYPHLFSFAYTRRGEETVAEQVADSLEIDFEHISISHQEISDWYHSNEREDFDRESGILDSVPIYWLALVIKKLKEDSSIPSDAIIVTGDGAQTMPSHIPERFTDSEHIRKKEFIDSIIDGNHLQLKIKPEVDGKLRERVLDVLEGDLYEATAIEPADRAIPAFEEWDWQERQCKSIRSNFVYEYFDYEWWCPFLDHEYMDFWCEIPLQYRQGKSFHDKYVERQYREITREFMVEAGFLTIPKWLWFINSTVGKVPMVGPFARLLYRRLFESEDEYDPKYGMLSEEQFENIVNELIADEDDVGKLTPRHIHALNLLNEYQLDTE